MNPYNWIEQKLSGLLGEKRVGLVKALSVILVLLAAGLFIYLLLGNIIMQF